MPAITRKTINSRQHDQEHNSGRAGHTAAKKKKQAEQTPKDQRRNGEAVYVKTASKGWFVWFLVLSLASAGLAMMGK